MYVDVICGILATKVKKKKLEDEMEMLVGCVLYLVVCKNSKSSTISLALIQSFW